MEGNGGVGFVAADEGPGTDSRVDARQVGQVPFERFERNEQRIRRQFRSRIFRALRVF